MPEPEPPRNLRASGERIEQALAELEECRNPARSLALAEELLRLMSDLYGAGLAQVVALVGERDPALLSELADDELVGSLLLVHGLHPSSLEARVEGALAKVRPFLGRHGGDVELLGDRRCAGCREAAPARELRRLPVVGGHAAGRGGGGHFGGGARSDADRGGGERGGRRGRGLWASRGSGGGEGQGQGTSVPITLSTKPLYTECPAEVSAL